MTEEDIKVILNSMQRFRFKDFNAYMEAKNEIEKLLSVQSKSKINFCEDCEYHINPDYTRCKKCENERYNKTLKGGE